MPLISGGSVSGVLSGVTISGTGASGKVPVATSASAGAWTFPPGYEFGYDQITSTINVTGTTQGTGTTIITCAAHTFDGSPVLVEFFGVAQLATIASDLFAVTLNESGAAIADLVTNRVGVATTPIDFWTVTGRLRFTPSAASHSYVITAYTASTTGTPTLGGGTGTGGSSAPCFVRFTKA